MKQTEAVLRHLKGLHTRVAALVVQRATALQQQWGVQLQIGKGDRWAPADNLLALVSLKTQAGDRLRLKAEGGGPPADAEAALSELALLLESELPDAVEDVDEILHETTLTLQHILDSLPAGLVVVNAQNVITLFNRAAERILGVTAASSVGRPATEVIVGSLLWRVLETGQGELGQRLTMGEVTILTTRVPILAGGRVIGALAIFQDISDFERLARELQAVKLLQERLLLVLESVAEGICVIGADGMVDFVNQGFLALTGREQAEVQGAPADLLLARSVLQPALGGKKTAAAMMSATSGDPLVSDLYPIAVDGRPGGAVMITRSASQVQSLADRLDRMTARAEYLEHELRRSQPPTGPFSAIVGRSDTLRDALAMAAKAAEHNSTVLIRGESGTGKEQVARAIHNASRRRSGPFVRVNCAGIPMGLLESELFGHERGAFTGAYKQKQGRFELADGGTIFLDEIGDLEPAMQAKILRILQEREFERVGGVATLKADVRVIAATHQPLEEMMERGTFRQDLYYRLNVIAVVMPPLRDRPGDIPLLAEYFAQRLAGQMGKQVKGLSREAVRALMRYEWPGNVRQLENVIERAMNLVEGDMLTLREMPPYLVEQVVDTDPARLVNAAATGELATWDEYEAAVIRLALRRHISFNAAAKALGLTHKTVAAKARKYGLSH